MAAKIVIDPVSRIEGHLKIEAVVENGVVKEAKSSGMMYRGFENILLGRDPSDAARIMQRICGVCPTSHGLAATFALDELYGVGGSITDNGRILRNLIQGANFVQSHILHFYQLAALDYVDVTAVADYSGSDPELKKVREFIARGHLGPFVPRYEGDYRLTKEENRAAVAHYVQALNMRRMAHEAVAVFGGKMPHNMSIVAGGVTLPRPSTRWRPSSGRWSGSPISSTTSTSPTSSWSRGATATTSGSAPAAGSSSPTGSSTSIPTPT